MGRGHHGVWERAETEQKGGLRSDPVAAVLSACDDRTQYGPLHVSPARSTCRSWAQWVNTGPHSCADWNSFPAGTPRGVSQGDPQVPLQGAGPGAPCPPRRDPHLGQYPALDLRSACSQHRAHRAAKEAVRPGEGQAPKLFWAFPGTHAPCTLGQSPSGLWAAPLPEYVHSDIALLQGMLGIRVLGLRRPCRLGQGWKPGWQGGPWKEKQLSLEEGQDRRSCGQGCSGGAVRAT